MGDEVGVELDLASEFRLRQMRRAPNVLATAHRQLDEAAVARNTEVEGLSRIVMLFLVTDDPEQALRIRSLSSKGDVRNSV